MDTKVARFIEEIQVDTNLGTKLSSNASSVITILGGIENVLKLCLTNPDADEEYRNQVISSTMKMIEEPTNTIDDVILAQLRNPVEIIATDIDPNDSVSMAKQNNTVVVRDTVEYEKSAIIVIPDKRKNLYFRWLNHDTSNWIMKILFNKWFCIGYVAICCTMLAVGRVAKIIYGPHNLLYLIPFITGSLLIIVICILFIMSMNLDILYYLRNSFDFWFKMWNYVTWQLSFIWLNIHNGEQDYTTLIINFLCILTSFVTIFSIDAIPMRYHVKKKCLGILVLLFSFNIIFGYLTYTDIYFNPFAKYNFEKTRISVKDLHLGAWSNILLFVAKPLLGDALRWVFSQYLHCTSKGAHTTRKTSDKENEQNNANGVERFVSLYKRSKVNWSKYQG